MKRYKHPISQMIVTSLVHDSANWEIGEYKAWYKRTGLNLWIANGVEQFRVYYFCSEDKRTPECKVQLIPYWERRRLLKMLKRIGKFSDQVKEQEQAQAEESIAKFVKGMALPYVQIIR